MNAEKKIKILTWGILALGLLTLSMLSAFFYHMKIESDREAVQLEFYSVQMTGRDFRDFLELTPVQMATFRNLNFDFKRSARNINVSLDLARTAMFEELRKKEPDQIKCKELAREIGQLHTELKEITCGFYLDIRRISNPEQVKKLEELFTPVFNSTGGFGYGRGRASGQGQGQRRFERR